MAVARFRFLILCLSIVGHTPTMYPLVFHPETTWVASPSLNGGALKVWRSFPRQVSLKQAFWLKGRMAVMFYPGIRHFSTHSLAIDKEPGNACLSRSRKTFFS